MAAASDRSLYPHKNMTNYHGQIEKIEAGDYVYHVTDGGEIVCAYVERIDGDFLELAFSESGFACALVSTCYRDSPIKNTKKNMKSTQQIANAIARKNGANIATSIVFADIPDGTVTNHVKYGYFKNTTGERVSNAYRRNFGWKNTSYRPAVCEVTLPLPFVPRGTI